MESRLPLQTSSLIESATPDDKTWVGGLFGREAAILGRDFGSIWWRYWQQADRPEPPERWVVIRPWAFAHYRLRRDAVRTLYEIAVSADKRRQGFGAALIEFIGRPLQLKTNFDDIQSNGFYRSLGFQLVATIASKTQQRKRFNVYLLG